MALFGIWSDFGFRENPYSQDTLGPDSSGSELLTGRDDEVQRIQRLIGSAGAHPSIEGPVGAGKTSLLNVASFRMAQHCLASKAGELYIPATERFQPTSDLAEFEAHVFRVIAQTLIRHQGDFAEVGLEKPDVAKLNRWLNAPQYEGRSGGLNILGNGAEAGRSSEPNTSQGFERSGFQETIKSTLSQSFPLGAGGIICVIDNLEIVESTGAARATLDELRDRLFNIPQIRWILCGSRGIVSRARTERLSGIFQAPIVIKPLDDDAAVEAVRRRIEYYGNIGAIAPVTPDGFEFIYQSINKNLREALSTAQEFSHWISTEYPPDQTLPGGSDRTELLKVWLAERAQAAFEDAKAVQPRHWQFFEEICKAGGRTGSGDYEQYGFGYQQQMVSAVTALAGANLMVREVDPDDGNRTVNAVTAQGWLVYFYRADFELPAPRTTKRS